MARRKRPHLDEPTTYLNATIFERQYKWLHRRADRLRVYPSAVVRDAIEIYRVIILAYGKQPIPSIQQICIIIRNAITAYLAQQPIAQPDDSADAKTP